ncbi:T9SS type A sorting domain-containing protein [Psychroserpens damuponensis]|uniref:T9SS type A sorting domain-containing protein n=1 Tax=Psychroserpens damuponensis TaxID=943936 RepID=UPI00058C3A9C|nr:T9SS type A sorting domain-containing protein [Psychroserpens damuponensis]
MKLKTTRHLQRNRLFEFFILTILLCLPSIVLSQTVTNVFPTRVTTSSKVTIIGTGFTAAMRDEIRLNGSESSSVLSSRTLVSDTEMTFVITINSSSNSNRTLSISGVSFSSGVANSINYIAPVSKSLGSSSENIVKEVYTTWDQNNDGVGFWKSSDWSSSSSASGKETWPNDNHDLLGFKMNYGSGDIIFSTGVDDALLESELLDLGVDISDNTVYNSQVFNAYSSNGVSGTPNSSNYLAMADKIDNHINNRVLNSGVLATVYDVIIDGVNGLDMGTGITNFNKNADIKFFSGNGQVGALDDTPDLIITQMAQPGGSDVYYYSDIDGNVVGTPIKLAFGSSSKLYEWRLDLYRLDLSSGVTYENSYPVHESFGTQEHRPFRMAAFKLEDFGLNTSNITDVNSINMGAGGSSDMAFMAYNKAAFEIKSPQIDQAPVSRYVCRLPTISALNFNAFGIVDDPTGDSGETISYQWYENYQPITSETSTSFTIPSGLSASDLTNLVYKVRIKNEYGAIDVPFTVSEGGTPTYWNGTNWVLAPIYSEITINQEDKNLIFTDDYNQTGDLVGCDCTVPAGKDVVIPSGSTIKLYNNITVEPEIPSYTDDDGNIVPFVQAGTFTLEDDASLIQIKNVTTNENSGAIKVKRTVEASTLHPNDYVYWSSPVANFNVSGISNMPAYQWSVNQTNANGQSGDWVAAGNTAMATGEGYIIRIDNDAVSTGFTSNFVGVPNNGSIDVEVFKTTGFVADEDNKNWNLIGNPYPSALNVNDFILHNPTIEGRVDLWLHNTEVSNSVDNPFYEDFSYNYGNQYVTYNGVGASNPDDQFDGNIASGQGFFVNVDSASPNTSLVSFTNDMRYGSGESAYDNSQFFRSNSETTTAPEEKQLVWLSLVNESNMSSSTLIGYVDGATNEKDRLYDAITNSDGFSLYSMIAEDHMVIQGRPLPFDESDTVPLGFELIENGIYKIGIDNLKGSTFLDDTQSIYIEDVYLGIIHDLRVSPYTFTGETGVFNDRLVLRYTASTLSIDDVSTSNTFSYVDNDILYVKSTVGIEHIEIYDLNGRQVAHYKFNGQSSTVNDSFKFSKGVYIISIGLEGDILVSKKIIN